MKIKIPVVVLIPIIIIIVLVCVRCGKKDDTKQENVYKIVTVSRGEWNANKYNNDFIKVKFNLPNNWNKYSDGKIAEMMNVDVSELSGEYKKIAELAEKQPVYVMAVNDPNTGAKVMIMLEKVTSETTQEHYVSTLKQQLESDVTINNEVSRVYTEMISGEEYKALKASMIDYQMERIYYIRKQNEYIVNIIISTSHDGQQEQILKYFE